MLMNSPGPAPGDEPPVLLQNNKWAKPFEFVIKLYSLPQYGTFDPTFIMSLFYFLIFGMMLADVVYGLLLVVFGLLIYKVLDVGEGGEKPVADVRLLRYFLYAFWLFIRRVFRRFAGQDSAEHVGRQLSDQSCRLV